MGLKSVFNKLVMAFHAKNIQTNIQKIGKQPKPNPNTIPNPKPNPN